MFLLWGVTTKCFSCTRGTFVLALKWALRSRYVAEFSLGLDAMKIAAYRSYCRVGGASDLGVNWARKLTAHVGRPDLCWRPLQSALGVGCASSLAGTHGSSTQAGLHLLLVRVVLLDQLTAWHYGCYRCPFLTLPLSRARRCCADWLDGRSHEGWHSR
jgi:hypothetical protein